MGVSIGTAGITCAYVGSSPLSAIYVWDTKVRPTITEAIIDWMLIWWGWSWWRSRCRGWGWGWAWWFLYCQWDTLLTWSYAVTIWAGGKGCVTWCCGTCGSWWNSTFNSIVAYWGWGWGWMMWVNTTCNWDCWGSWGGTGCGGVPGCGCDWQWNRGGLGNARGGGWWWGIGWYWGIAASSTGYRGWCGWDACCLDISGTSVWYASWWWGGGCCGGLSCGWWEGGWYRTEWCSATCYGSWGGWGWCTGCCSCCMKWGDGCQWVFIARYPKTCWYNITWGTKYECNWYCIHCFTSDWTLTVN